MRICGNYCQNFKGRFYVTTDSHARMPMLSGVLTEIEKQSKNTKEPQFYVDGGDFFGQAAPENIVVDIYDKFHQKNKDIPMIFNVGNVEIILALFQARGFEKPSGMLKKLSDIGKIVSLTMIDTMKKQNQPTDYLLPYTIIEDDHSGQKERILISGLTEFNLAFPDKKDKTKAPEIVKSDLEDMKRLLKDEILPIFKKENPDKTILLMHVMTPLAKELIKYAKELGIDNLKLVLGGHPHSVEDFTVDNVRALFPPAQGKGAFVVENTPEGIIFDRIPVEEKLNDYDYSPMLKSKSVIQNGDIYHPLEIDKVYAEILRKPEMDFLNEKIAISPQKMKYRNEYDFSVSEPTELGTFLANAYRDGTGADIGLLLSMDLREVSPPKGYQITYYNICDMLNVDKQIYKYDGVDADTLKDMFEVSLKRQNDGIKKRDFFEYSDNIKIVRKRNAKENEPKIVQIFIKENGEFIPLLDENQKQLSDRKYTVTTCDFVAKGPSRETLSVFQKPSSSKLEGVTGRKLFANQYRNAEKNNQKEFKPSVIIDV